MEGVEDEGGRLWAAETALPDRKMGESMDVKNGENLRIHSKVAFSLPRNSNYCQRGG